MILRVKATPSASANEVIGWVNDPLLGDVLKIRIKAPATEGKANKALLNFIADELGLRKAQVTLCKGQQSRIKAFVIPDDTRLSTKFTPH